MAGADLIRWPRTSTSAPLDGSAARAGAPARLAAKVLLLGGAAQRQDQSVEAGRPLLIRGRQAGTINEPKLVNSRGCWSRCGALGQRGSRQLAEQHNVLQSIA